MFKRIVKRDGKIVKFDPEKITEAIAKAGLATEEFKHDRASVDGVELQKDGTSVHSVSPRTFESARCKI